MKKKYRELITLSVDGHLSLVEIKQMEQTLQQYPDLWREYQTQKKITQLDYSQVFDITPNPFFMDRLLAKKKMIEEKEYSWIEIVSQIGKRYVITMSLIFMILSTAYIYSYQMLYSSYNQPSFVEGERMLWLGDLYGDRDVESEQNQLVYQEIDYVLEEIERWSFE